jgi:environmental stress-induced protein Ves
MRILHLTEKDYKVGLWSGGSTTELFIWPEGADYAKREFTLRVSSARVDLEESDFTPLMGVTRYITPLSGGFTLTHPGTAPVVMGPLAEPYRFSGEIATHCVGKATDFNLMLKGCEGKMELHRSAAPIRVGFNGFYAVEEGTFSLNGQVFPMQKGELLTIFSQEEATLDLGNAPSLTCWVHI